MDWVDLLQLLGILSGLMFIGSLLVVPWLLSRLSEEYFIRHRKRVGQRRKRHPVLTFSLWFSRNLIGIILLAAGLAMLFLPGQGLLTLLVGLSLMDFPGKHRMLERFVKLQEVRKSLNWVRRKAGKRDFVFKEDL